MPNENNICHKAVELFLENSPWFKGGVSISIDKKIPVSSGLGGGSSNVASVMMALNTLLDLNWDITKISKYALSISNDAYFFCFLRPCYISNSSYDLIPLPTPVGNIKFAIVNPNTPFMNNKTSVVFKRIKSGGQRKKVLSKFYKACLESNVELIQHYSYNNFIKPDVIPEYNNAFKIQNRVKAELGINLTFSATGPFLVYAFEGDKVQELETICESMGGQVFYSGLLNK